MEITSKQRAWLRSKAASIDTIFQIGKGGVNENMLEQMEKALEAREMIKCKVLENCEYTPHEAADGIAAAINAQVVTVIGMKFVLFKISPTKRQYDLNNLKMITNEEKKAKPIGNNSKRKIGTGGKKPSGIAGKKAGNDSGYKIIKKNSK